MSIHEQSSNSVKLLVEYICFQCSWYGVIDRVRVVLERTVFGD